MFGRMVLLIQILLISLQGRRAGMFDLLAEHPQPLEPLQESFSRS